MARIPDNAAEVTVHCPACGARNTSGKAWTLVETLKLWGLIPILSVENTFVVCGSCQKQLLSKIGAARLATLSADGSEQLLVPRIPGVCQFLAVLAAIFMIWPGVGLIVATIALLANRKSLGWPKKLAKGVFFIALVWTLVAIALAIVAAIMSGGQ